MVYGVTGFWHNYEGLEGWDFGMSWDEGARGMGFLYARG